MELLVFKKTENLDKVSVLIVIIQKIIAIKKSIVGTSYCTQTTIK